MIKDGYLGEWIVREVKKHRDEWLVKGGSKAKDGGRAPPGDDDGKTYEIKFVRAGSIRTIFGGQSASKDNNKALERYTRKARFRPPTNVNSLEFRPPKLFRGESADITFTKEDARWVHHPHNDALVVTMQIGSMNIHRVFVENRSSTNILYYSTFKKLGLPDMDMTAEDAWIYGFSRESVRVMGAIRLPVTLGEGKLLVTQMTDFMVLDQ